MPGFTSTNNNPDDAAMAAFSSGEGLHAESTSATVAAVAAFSLDSDPKSSGGAMFGLAKGGGAAIVGRAEGNGAAIVGQAMGAGDALVGEQLDGNSSASGVRAECKGSGNALHAKLNNPNSPGAALFAEHIGDGTAGFFKGNVIVTGDVSFPGMDCAEEFVVSCAFAIEPGTLMVIGSSGVLEPARCAYDRKVVGVVAGAGAFRPGIVMGKGQHGEQPCRPIALVGRAYCKADAAYGAIRIGDLLTSSPHEGHAMKARDRKRAFGAVIGKALAPLDTGTGLVPIVIALQ